MKLTQSSPDAATGTIMMFYTGRAITGVHVSDGNPTAEGIPGAKVPELFSNKKWRWFYTQQHGDNYTWEVTER